MIRDDWFPQTPEDIALVRAELERITSTHHFRKSSRYPQFLSYVVECLLQEETEDLKERTIAINILGRSEDFDASTDTIVRFTAKEIRKRLALVYQESEPIGGIRIELPLGGYLPRLVKVNDPAMSPEAEASDLASPEIEPEKKTFRPRIWFWALVGCGTIALAALALYIGLSRRTTDLDRLWEPVIHSNSPVRFIVSSPNSSEPAGPPNDQSHPPLLTYKQGIRRKQVNFLDILCASDIRDFLTARGRQTLLVRSDFVAFGSLREGPSVLIGGFDNVWTMQLTTSLRYYLVRDGDTLEIRDHNDVKQVWSLSEDADLSQLKVDYALLGRFRSPDTQQITYLASGLGQYGTVAAARFLDEPKLFLAVETQLHRKIGDDNFEAIVSTDIIKGSASTPRILAVHTWR